MDLEQLHNGDTVAVETIWDLKDKYRRSNERNKNTAICLTPGQKVKADYLTKILQNPRNDKNREIINSTYNLHLPLINTGSATENDSPQASMQAARIQLASIGRMPKSDNNMTISRNGTIIADGRSPSLGNEASTLTKQSTNFDPSPMTECLIIQRPPANDNRVHSCCEQRHNSESTVRPFCVTKEKSQEDCLNSSNVSPMRRSLVKTVVDSRLSVTSDLRNSSSSLQRPTLSLHQLSIDMVDSFDKFRTVDVSTIRNKRDSISRETEVMHPRVRRLSSLQPPVAELKCMSAAKLHIPVISRRYLDMKSEVAVTAAITIQATYRMYRCRQIYLQWLQLRKHSTAVIARSWCRYKNRSYWKKALEQRRENLLTSFHRRAKLLASSWTKLTSTRHVVIHIPSLGYSERLRRNATSSLNLSLLECNQIARICEVYDSNVDVVYVSPLPMSDDMKLYYRRLLALYPAVKSGDVADISEESMTSRCSFIVPENLQKLPNWMCLSTVLKYSPKALKRIQSLICGRPVYIVSGILHHDDIEVSDVLGVPVLGTLPEKAQLYSTASGVRRILQEVEDRVRSPPGVCDVYMIDQLYDRLIELILNNPHIQRWMFKIDSECQGRGVASIDLSHLPCYSWIIDEAKRFQEKWSKSWTRNEALSKLIDELPTTLHYFTKPHDSKAYATWSDFAKAFIREGGTIEAYPPAENITMTTVDMLIDPTGHTQMLWCGDYMSASDGGNKNSVEQRAWGLSAPQASVEPGVLNEAARAVAEACRARGVLGHISIDFSTFINDKSLSQELWVTDVRFFYSEHLAMSQMSRLLTLGKFDAVNHRFNINSGEELLSNHSSIQPKENINRNSGDEQSASYIVSSTKLFHSSFASLRLGAFLQMCRVNGVGYDVKQKRGTVFALLESTRREMIGMLSIGESLQSTLTTFDRSLSVISQELNTLNKDRSKSNLKVAIDDIERTLKVIADNEKDMTTEEDEKS